MERILTVIASCRRENRNALAFLTDAVTAHRTGAHAPTLIPADAQQLPVVNPLLANC